MAIVVNGKVPIIRIDVTVRVLPLQLAFNDGAQLAARLYGLAQTIHG